MKLRPRPKVTCPHCHGKGKISVLDYDIRNYRPKTRQVTCMVCRGTGKIPAHRQ